MDGRLARRHGSIYGVGEATTTFSSVEEGATNIEWLAPTRCKHHEWEPSLPLAAIEW